MQLTDVDTDGDKVARQCLLHYDRTLEEITRLHTWNCSKVRTKLCNVAVENYPLEIVVSGTGVIDGTYPYDTELNGKPSYSKGSFPPDQIRFVGGEWTLTKGTPTVETWTNPSTDYEPPKCGWTVGDQGSPAPSMTYDLDFNWDNKADLPSDCLRPIMLSNNNTFYRMLRFNVDWAIEARKVCSNTSDAWLLYQKIPTIANMDALFLRAFYTALAIKIAIPLTGDREIRRELMGEFEQIIMPEARRVNGFEGYEHPVVDSEWLEATITPTTGIETWQALSVGDLPL